MLTIVENEVVYILVRKSRLRKPEHKTEVTPWFRSHLPLRPLRESGNQASPPPRQEAGPSREAPCRDIDMSTFEFPDGPFKRVWEELTELHNQYFRMEHITRGVHRALDNCGPGNTLRELATRTDRKKVEALETKKAQLATLLAAMTQELTQKSEEIRKYQAEHIVVLN